MEEPAVRIGKLAALSGVTVRTLHVYEARGLIVPLYRHENGYRYYDASLQMPIRVFGAALSLGLSLAEIGEIFLPVIPLKQKPNPAESQISMQRACDVYRDHIGRLNEQIKKLEGQRAGLEHRLDYCEAELKHENPQIGEPSTIHRRKVAGRIEYSRS